MSESITSIPSSKGSRLPNFWERDPVVAEPQGAAPWENDPVVGQSPIQSFEMQTPDGAMYEAQAPDEGAAIDAVGPMTPVEQLKLKALARVRLKSGGQQPIIAKSADGVRHKFPAGTSQDIIDRVMKEYAGKGLQTNSLLQDFRTKYPEYNDMPDAQLADTLHRNFYPDMSWDDFNARLNGSSTKQIGTGEDVAKSFGTGIVEGTLGLAALPAQLGQHLGKLATSGIDYMMGVSPEETTRRQQQTQAQLDNGGILPNPANLQDFAPTYEPQTTSGKYAKTVGQFLPSAIPGGLPSMGAKLIGATTAGLASEGAGQLAHEVSPEHEGKARLVAGIIGGLTPGALRKTITPNAVSQERKDLLAIMKKEGVELTAGQTTGRKGLLYAESELGGGKAARMMERQGEQFTKAALDRAGIIAERATPEVMDKAFVRIGGQFDRLAAGNRLIADPKIAQDLTQIAVDYGSVVAPNARAPVVEKMINDTLNELSQHGFMSGKAYQHHASRLRTMARSTRDPELKSALNDIVNALDTGMERTIAKHNPNDLGAWKVARKQYRNLMVLERAATYAGSEAAQGIISPSALRNATIQNFGRRSFARGKGDFADLARAGEATMKPLPQSGTAPRTAARAMGTSIPTLMGAAMGYGAGPMEMVAGGLAGAAVPYAIGRALLSKGGRKYLGNQLLSGDSLKSRERLVRALSGSAPQINYAGGR